MAAPPPITYASTTRIGIGTTAPGASLTIAGNLAVGAAMSNIVPPADSIIIGGSVGIGTTAPQAALDVVGNLSATAIPSVNYVGSKTFVFNPTNSTGRYFIGKITGGSMVKVQIFDSGYSHGCGLEATINLQWGNSTTNVPNITVSTGQNQLYEFYIQGTQNSGISYLWFNEKQDSAGNNITYIVKIFANGSIDLNTTDGLNGSAAALISRGVFNINGSVGIGTTVPQESLHINGNIKISNNLLNSNGRIILNQTGNVLQTQSIYTGAVNNTSTASNTIILQLSITPSSTSSKIAIFASMKGVKAVSGNTLNYGWLELFRNSTSLAIVCDDVGYTLANGKSEQGFTSYIDSPNTTNTITYYLTAQHITSGLKFYWRNGGITLMELAG